MKPARLASGRILLKLACAGLLLGGAAQARHDACDLASARSPGQCSTLVAAADLRDTKRLGERMTAGPGPGTMAVGATRTPWQPERRMDTTVAAPSAPRIGSEANAASGSEPPLLGLLFAALGVVAFVAHRRSGR